MKILAIGDVVGSASIGYLTKKLSKFREYEGIDLVCVNGENASAGNGLTRADAEAIFAAGADVITTGNHIWKYSEIRDYLDDEPRIIRPANYPGEDPGRGCTVIEAAGKNVLVMNVAGVIYGEPLDDPFRAVEKMLDANAGTYDLAVLDVHAEATSEKAAIARCFDGRIAAVWGTHTHVQTNDARILPKGTAFITDLGMTGPDDSILGVRSELIITKLRTHLPVRFDVADGAIRCDAALFTLDGALRAVSAEAVQL